MHRRSQAVVVSGLSLVAALLANSATGAGLSVVEPADRVATVVLAATEFRAQVTIGEEDHTGDASYLWEFEGGVPETSNQNPAWAGFVIPGPYTVRVYAWYDERYAAEQFSVDVIGGAGSMEKNGVLFFLHAPYESPPVLAHAASGQPLGVEYNWRVYAGTEKAELAEGQGTEAASFKATGSSSSQNDIWIAVDYSLRSTTQGYDVLPPATSHKPTVPYSKRDLENSRFITRGDPDWEQEREVDYHCKSQFGLVMEGIWCDESVWHDPDSPYQGPIKTANAQVPPSGIVTDHCGFCKGSPWSGEPIMLSHAWQHVWLGGWHGEDTGTMPFWHNEIIHDDVPSTTVIAHDGHG